MSSHPDDPGDPPLGVLRDVFAAAPSAMVLVAADGRIRLANQAAASLFGYAPGELHGLGIEVLVPPHYRDLHPLWRRKYGERPTSRAMGAGRDLFGVRKDGREVPIEIGLNPIDADGEPLVLAAVIDISHRVRSEAALRTALHEKETLLREIHHRVKNNMQVVSSMLGLQTRYVDDAAFRASLDECRGRVRSMALIHEKLYRSDSLATIDFGAYAGELARMLVQAMAPDGNVRLRAACAPLALPIDLAVPAGLILNELLTNALKHGFADGRPGDLHVTVRDDGPHGAALIVADDGRGLPPAFDPASDHTLGLRIVRSLLRQLDGALHVADDGRAAFTVTFPLATAATTSLTP
ncbi:MAG: sensor histidine kinase [Planctomycetota bacterium]